MYKLLMRAFPGWYRANSVYALYPFTTPEGNKEIFQKKTELPELNYSKPVFVGPPQPVATWQGVVDTLQNQAQFHVPCQSLPIHNNHCARVLIFDRGSALVPTHPARLHAQR